MVAKLKQWKWYFFVILGVLILSAFIFRQYMFGGGYYFLSKGFMSDLLRANLPTYYQLYDSIASGGNFWSWKMGIGTSMFTHADVYFDPFTYILFLFGRNHIPNMMIWLFVIKLVFEGISFFTYISYFKIDKRASLIASLIYAFSGYSLVMGNNFALGTILVYAPLIFLGIEKWLDFKQIGILMAGLLLTCLYSYYFFYIVGIISVIYLCIRGYQRKERLLHKIILLAGMAFAVILLSAFALLPQVELVLSSARLNDGKSVGFSMNLFLPQLKAWITAIIRCLCNDILGNLTTASYTGYAYFNAKDYFQMSCYSSAFLVILLFQFFYYEKDKIKYCVMVFGILSIMTIFPIFPYILNACANANARWMFVVTIIECIGIGFSINSIIKNGGLNRRVLVYGIIASGILIVTSLFLLSIDITTVISVNFINYIAQAKDYIRIIVILYIIFYIIYLLQDIRNSRTKNVIISFLVIVLLFIDLGLNHYQCYGMAESVCEYSENDKSSYEDTSAQIIRDIRKNDESFYRINKTFDSVYSANGIPSENDAMVQRYFGLKSYNSLNNPSYIEYLQRLGVYIVVPTLRERYIQNGISPESITGSMLNYIDGVQERYHIMNYLGVKYLLTNQENQVFPENFQESSRNNGLICYKNTNYYPLAFSHEKNMSLEEFFSLSYDERELALLQYTVIDGIHTEQSPIQTEENILSDNASEKQKNFKLISFSEDYIKFDISIGENSEYLSTTIPFDKNWNIYIDGEKVESCKLNIALLGAEIKPGIHTVKLKYTPKYFYVGLLIAAVTLLLLILFRKKIKKVMDKIEQMNGKRQKPVIYKKSNSFSDKTTIGQTRNSSIELCRIICMLMVIAHHCSVHGGSCNMPELCTNKIMALFLVPAGKLGFDCFLAISCWYLVDQNYRTQRFLKIWLQVLFYSVVFAIVAFLFGTEFTLTSWFSVFLPITGNSHGFAASYLALYLLLPFLKRMTQNLNRKQARWLLALLTYFEVISQIIGQINHYFQPLYSELLLFTLCYVIALNLKRWPIKICKKKGVMLGIFCSVWYLLFIIKYLYAINPQNPFMIYFAKIFFNESSITNLIGGFSLFFVFINMKERKISIINTLATGTFGILLFHDHNFFRYVLWRDIIKADTWYYNAHFVLILIGVVILIYSVGFIIDRIRFYTLEKRIFSNNKVIEVCKKMDAFINAGGGK